MNNSMFTGVTVVMVSVFLTVMMKGLRYQSFYHNDRWVICVGLVGLGFLFLLTGFLFGHRPRPRLEEGELPSPQFPLTSLAYWGFLFLLFGGVAGLVSPKTRTVGAAESTRTNSITKPIVAMDPKFSILEKGASPAHAASATNQLATLKLQGIVYDKAKPSAIINGRTYFVGDSLRDAKVVSIEPAEVVVELMEQKRTLRLGE
jgi:hypothetical protein